MPAATALARRVLERMDPKDPLAVAVRAAQADPDGTRLERFDAQEEAQTEAFFALLQPLLEADPALKAAYYGTGAPPDLADAAHHAAILRRGHDALELLERAAALPPSDVEIERRGKAIIDAVAKMGGALAYQLLERLPELAAHQRDVEEASQALYRAAGAGEPVGQANTALGQVERTLATLRGAIARETVYSVVATLDGLLDYQEALAVGDSEVTA